MNCVEIVLIDSFIKNDYSLFELIKKETVWDNSFKSRKTSSYGKPYNYSGKEYDFNKFPDYIERISNSIKSSFNYNPNNCLLNYYDNFDSFMGYHSDETNKLKINTGVTIISLGSTRVIKFKNKKNNQEFEFSLKSGSLLYMGNSVQNDWLHSILKLNNNSNERISLSFREVI